LAGVSNCAVDLLLHALQACNNSMARRRSLLPST
jgi:hypothetical protein